MVTFHLCTELNSYITFLHTYTTTRDCHELLLVLINIQLEHACLTYIIYLLQSDFRKQKHILVGCTDSAKGVNGGYRKAC